MFRAIVSKYTVPQRNGKNPDIEIIQTEYIPIPRAEIAKLMKNRKRQSKQNKLVDYGITESQFEDILDKASKPIKNEQIDKEHQT